MAKATPPGHQLNCRAQLILLTINTSFIIAGLIGVMGVRIAFERWYQQPLCFRYAQGKGVPDLEHLQFEEVGIASNQYQGHHCNFVDTRTGAPVLVQFDKADVPYGFDTLQVCLMIVPVAICGLVGSILWSRYYGRYKKRMQILESKG